MLFRSSLLVAVALFSMNAFAYPVEYPRPEFSCVGSYFNPTNSDPWGSNAQQVKYQVGISAIAPGLKEISIYEILPGKGPVLKHLVKARVTRETLSGKLTYTGYNLIASLSQDPWSGQPMFLGNLKVAFKGSILDLYINCRIATAR